jgi:hypothetical protein
LHFCISLATVITNILLQTAENMKATYAKTPQSPTDGSSVAAVLMDVSRSSTGLAQSDFCLFSPL